ncbi:MAG: flagellar basal-body MS-ring/collar protein FliF, partial [Rhodospirillales bacterium]
MRGLGPVRLAMMGGVMYLMLGFFIFLLTKLGQPNMALLFSELNSTDSNTIAAEVGRLGFPAEVRDQGTSVWVQADKALELRLKMADRGLPVGGKVGFEIFDETDTLGTTDFLQNVNLRRALEGELGRTIQSMEIVHRARVHLVMPRRQLFSREEQQPSASVVLAMRSNKRLDHEQVSAVQNLVASAVPGLKPGRITIIDDKGKLLSPGFEDDQSVNTIAAKNEERRRGVEARMARTIEELLEKTVGFGNVRAEVNADMDFDRVSTTEEIYNPDGQVVRSTQTVERAARNQESETDPVTVGTNLPDAAPGGG